MKLLVTTTFSFVIVWRHPSFSSANARDQKKHPWLTRAQTSKLIPITCIAVLVPPSSSPSADRGPRSLVPFFSPLRYTGTFYLTLFPPAFSPSFPCCKHPSEWRKSEGSASARSRTRRAAAKHVAVVRSVDVGSCIRKQGTHSGRRKVISAKTSTTRSPAWRAIAIVRWIAEGLLQPAVSAAYEVPTNCPNYDCCGPLKHSSGYLCD